jgi:hypothetical protein
LAHDPDVVRWIDDVTSELQRVLDEAEVSRSTTSSGLGAADAEAALRLARDAASELRAWSQTEAALLVEETRRQVLGIYERLRLGVLQLKE